MITVDFDSAIREVLASSGQISFKRAYRLDTEKYSWVSLFVRDHKARGEIAELGKKITEVQKSLIDKNELWEIFSAGVEQTRRNWLELLRNNLSKAQRHECGVIGGLHEYGVIRSELPLMAVTLISSEEIGDIIASLPDGVKRKKIEREVEDIRTKIAELEEMIEKELSPPDRWIYNDTGKRLPYPGGCRWSKFVEGWTTVIRRFSAPADIEGCALVTEDEFAAFHILELSKVGKLSPLREPWKR